MRLIYITGFPRTGATWLHQALMTADNATGLNLEIPLQLLFETTMRGASADKIDAILSEAQTAIGDNENAQTMAMIGMYAWQMLRMAPTQFVSAWSRAGLLYGDDPVVVKCSSMRPLGEFPRAFVESTGCFREYRLLVCERNSHDTYESCRQKFRGFAMTEDEFNARYVEYYAEMLARDDAVIVEHAVMLAGAEGMLQSIAARCGLDRVRMHAPFVAARRCKTTGASRISSRSQ